MSEAMSMIIDTVITVLSAGVSIICYSWLMTSEPGDLSIMGFVVLLLLASIGAICTVAGIDAVVSYFTEPYIRK